MTFEVLTIIVVLSAMAIAALWKHAARKPPKPKKKFITALLHSEPIAPKHQPPKTIGDQFPSLVTEQDRLFFGDFADFADVVNWWLSDDGGRWRLQELPETELELDFSDTPNFGRRYTIFYNQVRLGILEVSPSFEYSTDKPNVYTNIELDCIRLLSFDTVEGFLTDIALHGCNPDQKTQEHFKTRQRIHRALTQVLWQVQQISESGTDSEDWGDLEVRLDGSATWYFTRRQALRKQQAAA
jgi:hypothetical protein